MLFYKNDVRNYLMDIWFFFTRDYEIRFGSRYRIVKEQSVSRPLMSEQWPLNALLAYCLETIWLKYLYLWNYLK